MGRVVLVGLLKISTVSCLLLGCSGTVQTVDISHRTRVYQADYQKVLKAVVDYCNDIGFPVSMAEKESGQIDTGYRVNEGLGMPILVQSRARVSFSLEKLSDSETKMIGRILIGKEL